RLRADPAQQSRQSWHRLPRSAHAWRNHNPGIGCDVACANHEGTDLTKGTKKHTLRVLRVLRFVMSCRTKPATSPPKAFDSLHRAGVSRGAARRYWRGHGIWR